MASKQAEQQESATLERQKTKKPKLYKVLLHNDSYTTMEFVVEVLMHVFQKSAAEATQIMLHIHHRGIGVCGVFIFDVAESKVQQVIQKARKKNFPLRCTMEPTEE